MFMWLVLTAALIGVFCLGALLEDQGNRLLGDARRDLELDREASR